VVVPLTSQIRGLRGEVPLGKPRWLPKISAVNVQGLASFDPGKLARRLGTLSAEQYNGVKLALRDLLRLGDGSRSQLAFLLLGGKSALHRENCARIRDWATPGQS
jgi:hypothetical protein